MQYKLEFKDGKLKKIKMFDNIIEIYKEQKLIVNSVSIAKELAKELFLSTKIMSGFKQLNKVI